MIFFAIAVYKGTTARLELLLAMVGSVNYLWLLVTYQAVAILDLRLDKPLGSGNSTFTRSFLSNHSI